VNALSDYLLQSGFQDPYGYYDAPDEQTMEELRQAIEQALLDGEIGDESLREQIQQMLADGTLDELIDKLIERMQQEEYITIDKPRDPSKQSSVGGQVGDAGQARFEVTDKGLDLLGYKSLRDLLGSLGKASFGRHDTRDMATGIEANGLRSRMSLGIR